MTLREQAEKLAGPHDPGWPESAPMCPKSLDADTAKFLRRENEPCSCGQAERVAGILKLMEDCETAKVDTARLLARHEAAEAQVTYEQERNANNIAINAEIHHDLTVKLEAAEAKVKELEEKLHRRIS